MYATDRWNCCQKIIDLKKQDGAIVQNYINQSDEKWKTVLWIVERKFNIFESDGRQYEYDASTCRMKNAITVVILVR